MQSDPAMPTRGPCSGLSLLDFTTMVSGPVCTQYLGDLGMDVLKVEPPTGDPLRAMGGPARQAINPLFAQFNRNKRSIVLDLGREEGRAVAARLARGVDVLVENFRPGVAERLGIGYEQVRRENPTLVYVAISGFGPDGPYADRPAYDHVVQGLSGAMAELAGDGPPRMIPSVLVDKSTGLAAGAAALGALLARERDGSGQRIDTAMLDVYASFMLPESLARRGFPPFADGASRAAPAGYRTWAARDGHLVGIAVTDAQFRALCEAIGRDELPGDPRFATIEQRTAHLAEIERIVAEEFGKWDAEELAERLRRCGAPFGPVRTLDGFLVDPQVRHNRTVFVRNDAPEGSIAYFTHPARYGRTPASLRRHPPAPGQHTDEVLREAGFEAREVASLRERDVVR